jgi:hypothetical protein
VGIELRLALVDVGELREARRAAARRLAAVGGGHVEERNLRGASEDAKAAAGTP